MDVEKADPLKELGVIALVLGGCATLGALVIYGAFNFNRMDPDIQAAEKAVRYNARDPDAVQFREVKRCSNDKAVIRGEYNGKNGYGAYAGFEPFYYSAEHGLVLLNDADFSSMLKPCYGANPNDTVSTAFATGSSDINAGAAAGAAKPTDDEPDS